MLDGHRGEASRIAMRLIVEMAEIGGAARLIDVVSAHIDGCLYHGQAGWDWAARLLSAGARVTVPTTLNVSSLDLLHPNLYRGPPEIARAARQLMDAYVAMGCRATWTCAPYQLPDRPRRGEHIAWAESNAIVFANSVLGARTERYGDFIDVCAAITGRVPEAGLHLDGGRRGRVVFRCDLIRSNLLSTDVLYPVLGHLIGIEAGTRIPVVVGLPASIPEHRLKALGAAAASSGGVGMFHVVGVTPEAPTLDEALHGHSPEETVHVSPAALSRARASLSTIDDEPISAVSLGTPHYSIAEFETLVALVDPVGRLSVDVYVSTNRHVLSEIKRRGWVSKLEAAGVRIVVDTCTYITPILNPRGPVMTDSAKWAYYAPGNIGIDVIFGSTKECVRSAVLGRVWRDEDLWGD